MDFKTSKRPINFKSPAALSRPVGVFEAPGFKSWFRNSKVIDETGRPKMVFHGTPTGQDITEFLPPCDDLPGRHPSSDLGIFFSGSADSAFTFAGRCSPSIIPVYLSIQNPYFMTWGEYRRKFAPDNSRYAEPGDIEWDNVIDRVYALRYELERLGHDGICVKRSTRSTDPEAESDTWVVFRPEQIKSAIGNKGSFDPHNPEITS